MVLIWLCVVVWVACAMKVEVLVGLVRVVMCLVKLVVFLL